MIIIENKSQWQNKNHLGRCLNKFLGYKFHKLCFNDFTQNLSNVLTRSKKLENLMVKFWY